MDTRKGKVLRKIWKEREKVLKKRREDKDKGGGEER